MENKKSFYVILILSTLFSFLGILTDVEFIPAERQNYYIIGRVFWGVSCLVMLILFYLEKCKIKTLVVPYLITMMLYSIHGQWFVPCYYLAFVEMLLIVGLFFPVDKNIFRVVALLSTIAMVYVVLNSPASYNIADAVIDKKFRYDATMAVLIISVGAWLGHTYITLKREQKDEAYRKFLDIGKYSSFLFHDFKGLLSTPLFYAEMLMQTLNSKVTQEEIISKLNEDLNFLQDYAKEIMKLTLPENHTYVIESKLELKEINRTLNILLRKQLFGISFNIQEKDSLTKPINSYKMIKVFYNAILNSVEHLKQAGTADAKVEIMISSNNIQIRDNGKGFPEKILKQLNQDEVMISTKDNGSGIGTAIIKDLIKSMDGKVEFLNNNGAVININF